MPEALVRSWWSSLFLILLTLLCACGGGDELYDFDGDGIQDADDCAPSDADRYPGAADPFGDEVDSNCDGSDGVDLDGDSWAGNAG